MALLELKDIGKIYSSAGAIAVGIRHVNASFDIGEFVAITGKSGCGKTTLLNVMSGLDSYEEGEMLVEGNETSHFISSDWEQYRQKFISFIFQDYNIIESFSVLENVEFALMNIQDFAKRRQKAMQLITKVGLAKFANQKGSKLSGGQKQRTVIARALAKDSPIILADEPTGNLDSESSKEIIQLLGEISKDKLVVVVTHNLDEVKAYATREIRIFDGEIEHDDEIQQAQKKQFSEKDYVSANNIIKESANLGWHKFMSKPKLTSFLTAMFCIASLGLFLMTSLFFMSIFNSLPNQNLFEHIDGRVLVVRQDGGTINEQEAKSLAEQYSCDYQMYDSLLDYKHSEYNNFNSFVFEGTFKPYDGTQKISYGRAPQSENEIIVSVPIYLKDSLYQNQQIKNKMMLLSNYYEVVGLHFYYDNTQKMCIYFTQEGFKNVYARVYASGGFEQNNVNDYMQPVDRVVISSKLSGNEVIMFNSEGQIDLEFNKIDFKGKSYDATPKSISKYEYSNYILEQIYDYVSLKIISQNMAQEIADDNLAQFSLFFKNDKQAKQNIESLCSGDYAVALSSATFQLDIYDVLGSISIVFSFLGWALAVFFVGIFVALICMRANASQKSDIAILRTMGIRQSIIKSSTYWYNFFAMIPSLLVVAITAITIYMTTLNELFLFLPWWCYCLIFMAMVCVVLIVSKKFNKKLFAETVRKNLKAGRVK